MANKSIYKFNQEQNVSLWFKVFFMVLKREAYIKKKKLVFVLAEDGIEEGIYVGMLVTFWDFRAA